MKKILLLLLIVSTSISCNKQCKEWYEGKGCKVETREKFIRNYEGELRVNRNGLSAELTRRSPVSISKGKSINQIYINLEEEQFLVEADLTSQYKFKINHQRTNDYVITHGSGEMSENRQYIWITYYKHNGGKPTRVRFNASI